jgi:hypothetical protein
MKLSEQKRNILIISIIFFTAIIMTNYFEVAMTGVLAFFVAYLSKGLRKVK